MTTATATTAVAAAATEFSTTVGNADGKYAHGVLS